MNTYLRSLWTVCLLMHTQNLKSNYSLEAGYIPCGGGAWPRSVSGAGGALGVSATASPALGLLKKNDEMGRWPLSRSFFLELAALMPLYHAQSVECIFHKEGKYVGKGLFSQTGCLSRDPKESQATLERNRQK